MGFPVRGFVAVAGLLWLFAPAVTCGPQGTQDRQEEMSMQERPMQEKPIEAVLKANTDHLMSFPGVVGTGLGECAGQPCIKVFVVEKTSDLLNQIPSAIEGYKVEIQETGEIRALDPS